MSSTTAWTVLMMTKWDSLDAQVMGLRGNLKVEPKEMIGFMPVFATKEAAVKWAGNEIGVYEIVIGIKQPHIPNE